jgi:ankyrin repeat protein
MTSRCRMVAVDGILVLLACSFLVAGEGKPKPLQAAGDKVRYYLASYLGGSGDEFCEAIALDEAGNIYVTGSTTSADFPVTAGSFRSPARGKTDVFVMKFDKDLKTLLASAVIGGDEEECSYSIAYDRRGFVYVAGYTASPNFPTTPAAYGPRYKGGAGDAFILKLDRDLTKLAASSFLGGSGNENDWRSPEIVQDEAGRVYVAGITDSADFPTTPGAFRPRYNGGPMDVFLSEFDSDLKTLLASTFLGGSGDDRLGRGLAVVPGTKEICLAGYTMSLDFPVAANAFSRRISGELDGYVAKFTPDLSRMTASTILEGGWIYCLLLHENGDIYVGGHAASNLPTTAKAYYRRFDKHSDQGFISGFSGDLTRLKASTVLPGSYPSNAGEIACLGLAQSRDGGILAAGWAKPEDFPATPGAFDETANGGNDVFILKLDRELSELTASTFIGGGKNERWNRMATDRDGHIHVAGYTLSADFPTTAGSAYGRFSGGQTDGFIVKIGESLGSETPEPFHEAAAKNDLDAVRRFLSADPARLESRDPDKRTALHAAARYGALAVAGDLVAKGADVGAKDESGNTPLHMAAMFGREEILDLLLKRKADLNALNRDGLTPLYLAAYYGTELSLARLLDWNADPMPADKDGNTPLHIAALTGNAGKAALLSKRKAVIDARNKAGQTALHLAVLGASPLPIIEGLLAGGADIEAADATGQTVLFMARGGDTARLEFLLKRGAKIEARDGDGNSLLHGELLRLRQFQQMTGGQVLPPMIIARTMDRVRLFLAHGADPRLKNNKEQTPLDLAREVGDKGLLELLGPDKK